MSLSGKKILKYIKIILVHPLTEIIINALYLISFIFIGVTIFNKNQNYNNHQILDMTESHLDYNTFNNIKTPTQFHSYLIYILNKLYTINPLTDEIPLFIPISPVRFTSFKNTNKCNTDIDYTKTCTTATDKFKCVIDNLSKSFNLECGKSYSDKKNIFQKKLKGYYSNYNIRHSKNNIDLTKNTYYSTYQNEINEIIEDKQLKALVMQINLAVPSNKNYIDVILCLEMTNYFTDIKKIFSVYILSDKRSKTYKLLFSFITIINITIILNAIKLIYEINVKAIWSVHLFYFIHVIFDCLFMVICLIYLTVDKDLEFKVNLKEFESHLRIINVLWYMEVFYSLLVIFLPFRFFSLISWWKNIFGPLTILLNIFFRIIPAIFISFIGFFLITAMFIFINYFIYNDMFPYYESMFYSFLSIFNIRILTTLYDKKKPSRLFGNLFQSKYSSIIIFFEIIFIYFYSAIIISVLVYAYKNAIILQFPAKENKYIVKLKEIQKKLEEDDKKDYKNKDFFQKKHILWWNLDEQNTSSIEDIKKYNPILFKNSNQILSFLKYIFAVKPQLQFKKLVYKLNIVIVSKVKIGQKEIKEIGHLTEWLIFIGAKIPIIFYITNKLEHSFKMKLNNLYKLTYFVNNDDVLKKILDKNEKMVYSINESDNFTFFPERISNSDSNSN